MEVRFVEQKVLKLADCSFNDNPRGHNHSGLNVEKSVEKTGIDIAQTMIWRKAKKDDPKAHGATDEETSEDEEDVCNKNNVPISWFNVQNVEDKRFLECNVIVVSEDITKEEVTCLARSRIVQNEKGSKKKTFFDDYTSFKWLMPSVSTAIAKPAKLVIGPDERLEALLRENCEALGKDSPFGFNSFYDNKEFLRLSPTQR
eukprot:gene21846-26295_t